MRVTDRHDITLAVKVASNPDTANKPNCPRAKKKKNKECTIITITLVLKMDLDGFYPAPSHSQVGQPNHSARKAVKALEIAMLVVRFCGEWDSSIYSFTHSLIYSFTHLLIYSFTHLLIHSFTHLLIHSFTHLLIHSFTHLLIHSFTHSLIHS